MVDKKLHEKIAALSPFGGFMEFIKERGVVGLAIGFIIGGSVTKLVTALVQDIINPILGLVLGKTQGLNSATVTIFDAKVMWGHFLSSFIDFIVIAFVVYFGVKLLGLDHLDKKKNKKK